LRLFGKNPFAGEAPPKLMRVQLYTLLPTSIAEMWATGRYWQKTLFGPYLEPFGYDAEMKNFAYRGSYSMTNTYSQLKDNSFIALLNM
jgi:hypothetical protein